MLLPVGENGTRRPWERLVFVVAPRSRQGWCTRVFHCPRAEPVLPGARVIATAHTDEGRKLVTDLGADATAAAVEVINPTGHGVTLSVDVTKIPHVKVGEKATVVPDGSSVPLAATVSYVAAAPTTSGSTAHNVQLAFASNPTTLRDGIQAAVTITTAQAVNALAVPTSAVNHGGAVSYVLVLNGSTTKAQLITVGSVGATYTQVTDGLSAGQQVVLANPSQPNPPIRSTAKSPGSPAA
jgi:hypothetical protein